MNIIKAGDLKILKFILYLLIFTVLNAEEKNVTQERYADINILRRVQAGGFVIYLRHGKTDSSQPDQYPIDLSDCSTQRPLTKEGKNEIIMVGNAIKKAGIKVSQVYSSPLCRAIKSTQLAFGENFIVEEHLMYTAHLTTEEKMPILAKTKELLSDKDIPNGQNRALVAHAPNIADLINYFPETEGSLLIFKPLGNGDFEYIATILPNQWDRLLK